MWVGRQIAISWFAVILIFVENGADADDLMRFVGESHHALQAHSTPRDSELMTAVWNSIRTDGIVDSTTVEVTAEEGRITLTGMQPSLVARDRATYLAETVAGVRQVDNRMMVQRGLREADTQKLESDVLYMLLTDPATERSSIVVTADADGHVILSGTVRAYGERYLAEQLVGTVAGVRKVTNEISVQTHASVADRNLVTSLRRLLKSDAYIHEQDIHVSATQGVLTLKGSLRTLAEKRRVVELSWAVGARQVLADALRVSGKSARVHAGISAPPSGEFDEVIVAAARHALQFDPRVADCSIEIRVDADVVRLEGSVPSLASKRAALWLVRGIRGVRSIQDELHISEGARVFSDEEILLRIERSLMRNSLTREDAIAVSVRDGAVVFEGEARSWLARQFAESAAESVMGVGEITNEIVIRDNHGSGANAQFTVSTGVWWTPSASPTVPMLANAVAGTHGEGAVSRD